MKKELPTVEYLRKTIRYDAKTGKMYWLKRTNEHFPPKTANIEKSIEYWNNNFAGKETATCQDGRGYITEAASARSAAEKKYNFHPNHGRQENNNGWESVTQKNTC